MSFFENLEKLCEKTKYLEIDIKKQLKDMLFKISIIDYVSKSIIPIKFL